MKRTWRPVIAVIGLMLLSLLYKTGTEIIGILHVPTQNFHRVARGTNIQVADLQVHLTTAVYYPDFPVKDGFNIFLNGWARFNSSMDFKCCLLRSLGDQNGVVPSAIPAKSYKLYNQWIVDMQSAEFVCSLTGEQIHNTLIPPTNLSVFNFITFALNNCSVVPKEVLRIEYFKSVPNSVGVCLKISYGSVNPEMIVEWFEYMKIIGVTRVFKFLSPDLDPDSLDMFLYYKKPGFLEADPIHPAKSKNGPDRQFRRPRFEQQAWVDEVMACNDCKHRMSVFDYVIVMDLDEFIIPKISTDTLFSILQKTSKMYPTAGTFSFDSHVVMLDWKESRKSPLHLMSKIVRTDFANYDGYDMNIRWAFTSHRTSFVQNNKAFPREGYTSVNMPSHLYTLIHRRLCKPTWKDCLETPHRKNDSTILRYEKPPLKAIQREKAALDLLRYHNHTNYVNQLLSVTAL